MAQDRALKIRTAITRRTFSGKAMEPFVGKITCFGAEGTFKGTVAFASDFVKMDYKAANTRSLKASEGIIEEKTHLCHSQLAEALKRLGSDGLCCLKVPLP